MTTQDWGNDLPPELMGDYQGALRRRKIAEAMLAQSQQPLQAGSGGGYVTRISPLAPFVQGLSVLAARQGTERADADVADVRRRHEAGLADAVRQYQATKAGNPGQTSVADTAQEGTGSFDMSGAAGPEKTTVGAVPADPRKAVMDAMMSRYPQMQRIGQMDLQQLNRNEDREDTQNFQKQQLRMQLQARADELETRLREGRITKEEADARMAVLRKEMQEAGFNQQRAMAGVAAGLRQPPAPVAVMGPDGKPVYVSPDQAVGRQPAGKSAAQLPGSALKLQQEELDSINTASGINADVGALKTQIDKGELKLGPLRNLVSKGQNFAGMSDENSRNYATYQATLEKLRNDSLRLNKGVQTEGDAVRAWNELVANSNDPKVVSKRLDEIQKINERAILLRRNNINVIRSNYGVEPMQEGPKVVPAIGDRPTGAPDASAIDAELKRRGLR